MTHLIALAFCSLVADADRRISKSIIVALDRQVLFTVENGAVTHTYDCISGKAGNPTPVGNFTVSSKDATHFSHEFNVSMPYSLIFVPSRGIAIHQSPWAKTRSYAAYLGVSEAGSHGCIGLSDDGAAKSVFDWADAGTPVTIEAHDWGATWRGTARPAIANFGGGGGWQWRMTMDNISLAVAINTAKGIASATLTSRQTEVVLAPPGKAGIPTNNHSFRYTGGNVSGDTVNLNFVGNGSNAPKDAASFRGTMNASGQIVGTVTFWRTDQPGYSINWRTSSALTLGK